MVEYRGRKLNISDEFVAEYKKWVLIPLDDNEISIYIERELGRELDDATLSTLTDEQIADIVLRQGGKEIKMFSPKENKEMRNN